MSQGSPSQSRNINIPRRKSSDELSDEDEDGTFPSLLSASMPSSTGRLRTASSMAASPRSPNSTQLSSTSTGMLSSSFTSSAVPAADWRRSSRSSAGALSTSVDRSSFKLPGSGTSPSPPQLNYEVSPVSISPPVYPKQSRLSGWSASHDAEDRARRFLEEKAGSLARQPSTMIDTQRRPRSSSSSTSPSAAVARDERKKAAATRQKEEIVKSLGIAPSPPVKSALASIFGRDTPAVAPQPEPVSSPLDQPPKAPSPLPAAEPAAPAPAATAAPAPATSAPSPAPKAVAEAAVSHSPKPAAESKPAAEQPQAGKKNKQQQAPQPTSKTQAKKALRAAAKKENIQRLKQEKAAAASSGAAAAAPQRGRPHQQAAASSSPGAAGASAAASSSSAATATGGRAGQRGQVSKPMQYDDKKRVAKAARNEILSLPEADKQVPLFSHLQQVDRGLLDQGVGVAPKVPLHPSIMRLGLKYADRTISGSSARCLAMLLAFKDVLRDFSPLPEGVFHDKLNKHIGPFIQFLKECRPMSVSMGNAILWLKKKSSELPPSYSDKEAARELVAAIDDYIERRITKADEFISRTYGCKYIVDGDVILTFATSHVVIETLLFAKKQGVHFSVVVVDSSPRFEGRVTMKRLIKASIPCTYILINAVPYIIRSVAKVMVGASAFMNNGNAISRVGTAAVAMIASQNQVPVIFFCEIYKFCERALLDSICFNELAQPEKVVEGDSPEPDLQTNWRTMAHLRLLNLVYDVTPSSFIDMIITESGIMPATSVPAVTREIYASLSDLAIT